MTIRITLLVLLTGLFAAAWTGDGSSHDRRVASRPAVPVVGRTSNLSGPGLAADPSYKAATPVVALRNVPLPAGITPGIYRVVSNTGTVRRLKLSAEDLPRPGEAASPKEFYIAHETDCRWYFVRLDRQPATPGVDDTQQAADIAARQALTKIGRGLASWSQQVSHRVAVDRPTTLSPRAVIRQWTERFRGVRQAALRPDTERQ